MLNELKVRQVLDEIEGERFRQHDRWGQQNLPDGTGLQSDFAAMLDATLSCQSAFERGTGSYRDILAEEVAEVFAETDPARVRAELVQVCAVCVQWIEAIDRRVS